MIKDAPEGKRRTTMENKRWNLKTTTVAGKTFEVWSDYFRMGTYAADETGTEKRICGGSYLRNDLTIRKAIAATFGLPTFRK